MLLSRTVLEAIRDGRVTLAFRRWKRPTVRTGGRLRTRAGELEIVAVDPIEWASVTEADARAAGYTDRKALGAELDRRPAGDLYRIAFGRLKVDPRVALRSALPDATEHAAIAAKLRRLDAAARGGPWTRATLSQIAARPGVPAADLARSLGQEKLMLKRNVRKLKELGLTESLAVGYRLSPRGAALFEMPAASTGD